MRVSEIRVKRIRVSQGLGVYLFRNFLAGAGDLFLSLEENLFEHIEF